MAATTIDGTNFNSMSCLEKVQFLHDVYLRVLSGNQRTRVAYNNYTVEYRGQYQNDVKALQQLYTSYWNMCPEAQACMPDLSPGARARRGPPTFGTIGRGGY